jgi:glycosyltransferase involved in cell wall biosynthesis
VSRPESPDDLVLVLTYYTPYVSGLTNFARDIAEGLAARGRKVTVVTSQHDKALPREETVNGVRVLRAPVLAQLGKGTISPQFSRLAIKATRNARVVNLHLPMLEAGPIARAAKCPVVLTYHCDVSLPDGLVNTIQGKVIDASSRLAMRHATTVAVTSEDYARHSRLWPSIEPRMAAVPPPCTPCQGGTPSFRDGDGMHVGFLGRIVEEKGLEYLVDGFRKLDDPAARLLIGGEFAKVAGGSVVQRVKERIGTDPRIKLLGFLPDEQLPDFYASLDVFALPSVNAFEAFGIVQVVAMLAGVPALASDLPGVRIPVRQTNFGEIVTPRDVDGIHAALTRLRDNPPDRVAGAAAADRLFSVASVLDAYETIFDKAAGS